MTEQLKEGWAKVSFGDVVRLVKERSSDPKSDGFNRYVGLEHIDSDDLKIRSWGNVSDGTTFTQVFRAGQVLFGRRRAYLRKVALSDFDGVCSGDIYVFEPNGEHLIPELLPFICQTDSFFDYAVGTSAGSLSPRTKWSSLANFEFALPPLKEQKRVSSILWSFVETLNKFTALLHDTAVLLNSFVERTCWNNNLNHKPIINIVDPKIGSFRDGNWIETKDQSSSGIRLLQLSDIGRGEFLNKSRRYITEDTFKRLDCTEVFPGDLLISRMADPIGRSCIVPELENRCIAAVDCCIVKINEGQHDPHFWLHMLNSPTWMRLVESSSAGSTRMRISRSNLEKICVPIPDFQIQTLIASKLKAIANSKDYTKSQISSIYKLYVKLREIIL